MLPSTTALGLVAESDLLTVAGLPLHPLIVHAVVVLTPAAAVLFVAILLRPKWQAHYSTPVIAITWLAAVSAVAAVLAGDQLAEIKGVTEQHERSGRLLAITASALAVTATLWWWRQRTVTSQSTKDVIARSSAFVGILLSAIVLPLVVISGHSGAASVWGTVSSSEVSGPTAQDLFESGGNPDAQGTATAYTLEDVAANNSVDSCWSVVQGQVFDLTNWIAQHPGGPEAVISMCGTDSTEIFEVQHGLSGEPADILSQYWLGPLVS